MFALFSYKICHKEAKLIDVVSLYAGRGRETSFRFTV